MTHDTGGPKPLGKDHATTEELSEDSREPKPMGKDYATTEEVSAVAGVERTALYEWLREGLLPKPQSSGGRGIIAKWPLSTLQIAEFVRSQRDLAFGLKEIRPRLVQAFGEKILEVLADPNPRARARAGKKATEPQNTSRRGKRSEEGTE